MTLRSELFADYEAARRNTVRANWFRVGLGVLQYVGFRGVFLYRLGHRARCRGLRVVYRIFDRLIRVFAGLDISTGATIGPGLRLPHPTAIIIGDRTRIGERACILQGVTLGGSGKRKQDGQSQPYVGDDVLIGAGAVLIGPINVGHRARIGANAVVTFDLPDDATVIGNPGRIISIGDRRIGPMDAEDDKDALLQKSGEQSNAVDEPPNQVERRADRDGSNESRRDEAT